MDLSGTQGELAIPMHANTVVSPYGAGGHVLPLHHHHEQQHGTNTNTNTNNGQSPAAAQPPPSPPPAVIAEEMGISAKKRGGIPAAGGIGGGGVRYRECLKNHAAAIGGSATDGCGEFMPSGEDGSLEALKCSACGCHRNFHRKDLDDGAAGDADADDVMYTTAAVGHGHGHHRAARRLLAPAMPHPHRGNTAGGGGLLVPAGDPYAAYATAARALPPPPGHGHLHGHHGHQYVMPLSMVHNSESDEMDGGGGGAGAGGGGSSSSSRKRFRTKFTAEQKARMLEFAERVGWRLQKLDEAMVNGFCQEIGVKRRVLKVWMHNNKHNLATTIKRLDAPPEASPQMPPALQVMPPAGVMPAPAAMQQGAGPSCHRGDPASPPPSVLKLE